jgi:hypothetical protein
MRNVLIIALLMALAGSALTPTASGQQTPAPKSPQQTAAPKASTAQPGTKPAAPTTMTNRDVIALVKAKISDDVILTKINQSKTRFDTSTAGLVALKQAGVSDQLIAVMIGSGDAAKGAEPAPASKTRPALRPGETPSNAKGEVVATGAGSAPRIAVEPAPAVITQAPQNYGLYIDSSGQLKPLGRIETKMQVSKFRSLLKSAIPFVRQKVDINIPGAHASSRFEVRRPIFYAYFPPSRDVSKFKLLQCKITGQNFDQRTLANASILFSTEQNQDEVPVDIGPTKVQDLYRISPREDLPSGEFGFVEGNTGSKSASNIEILDVYDFGVDRKEEKLALADYLDTLPPAHLPDEAFLSWSKEDAQKIVDDREGKVGVVGSMLGWFKRQYAGLDVYWADPQFARAFTRLEMLDRNLNAAQANKLSSLLLSQGGDQYFILVSIGGKVGSGHLIGANEGERVMRPFDASLTNNKSKAIVPARKLEFVGGYAGLWKVAFDTQSIRGPLLNDSAQELVFEARLNQNLDFKTTFQMDKIMPTLSLGVSVASKSALAKQ